MKYICYIVAIIGLIIILIGIGVLDDDSKKNEDTRDPGANLEEYEKGQYDL
jgi:hypothetical protein